MPHEIQKQLIKKRLKGKEGKAKLREIERIEAELPTFTSGPYVELRKWLSEQARKTATRSKVKHQDWMGVKKEGVRQFVLVGQPNIGKSSLLKNLCGLQTEIGNYEFTTLKPLPGIVRINHADFQLVDLPGLVEGASENVGQGKRFLGIVKTADGVILMHDLTKPLMDVEKMERELEKSRIDKPLLVIGSKADLAPKSFTKLKQKFPNAKVIALSNKTQQGKEEIKQALWEMSGLIRVYPRGEAIPVVLDSGATVEDFAVKIHKDLAKQVKFARVTGPSSKFANQRCGLLHELADEDEVELVLTR